MLNPYDGRTRDGRDYMRGYSIGLAGKPIPETARWLSTWPAFKQGHAAGVVDQDADPEPQGGIFL